MYNPIQSNFSRYNQFFSDEQEKVLHVIETGFMHEENRFMVVHEDAYQSDLGKTELMSLKDLKNKYGINL